MQPLTTLIHPPPSTIQKRCLFFEGQLVRNLILETSSNFTLQQLKVTSRGCLHRELGIDRRGWKERAARLTGRISRQTPYLCMSCTIWWWLKHRRQVLASNVVARNIRSTTSRTLVLESSSGVHGAFCAAKETIGVVTC